MQTKCVYYNVWQSTDSCPAFGHSVVAAGGGGGGGGWQIEIMIYFGSGDYDDDADERKHSPSLSTWTRSAFKSYRPTLAGDQDGETRAELWVELSTTPNRPQSRNPNGTETRTAKGTAQFVGEVNLHKLLMTQWKCAFFGTTSTYPANRGQQSSGRCITIKLTKFGRSSYAHLWDLAFYVVKYKRKLRNKWNQIFSGNCLIF